ncbi:MAG TPA: two-component sensor histidine kinase, partial [Lachnospiraceae bacterium]|nr:two-component sensor histidine kinase [Lachnospiraceae bacterium]
DEELEHIFDRFYTGKNGNTGIGLALAKELIELHGWSIRAEKKDGGVLFRIKTEK